MKTMERTNQIEALNSYIKSLTQAQKKTNQNTALGDAPAPDFKELAEKQKEFVFTAIKASEPQYVIDDSNRWIWKELALWLFDNPEFERKDSRLSNPSLKKGILFSGNVGTGKSLTMRIFSGLSKMVPEVRARQFGVFECRAIVREFVDNRGMGIIDKYGAKSYGHTGVIVSGEAKRPIHRAFDGIGEEIKSGPVMIFGQKTNVIEEIMTDRYNQLLKDGMKTHGTTNLTFDEISEVYSMMVADRFKQMFNNIPFLGESKRA